MTHRTHRISARNARRVAVGLGLLAAAGASMTVLHGAAGAQSRRASASSQTDKSDKNARRYSYALTLNGSTYSFGMGFSYDDRALNDKKQSDRLLVARDKALYEITDRNTIEAVATALAPVIELGRQQGELGKQQGALGRGQGELGQLQGELGRMQGELARIMAQADEATRADLAKQQDELSRQQEALGHKQETLGRKQSALGKKQEALGRQQEAESRKADAKITPILDDAFARNLAKVLPKNEAK